MKHALGMALNEKDIRYSVVRPQGEILFQNVRSIEADTSRDELIQNIIKCTNDALSWCESQNLTICGLGIGVPGTVDNGLILGGTGNMQGWYNLPLAGLLERKLNIPVFVESDKNLEGLAEVKFGCAKGDEDVVFLNIGPRINGTMIINGRMYGGHRNRGAELGHIIVKKDGQKCTCGAEGCLEAYASTTALIKDYRTFAKTRKFNTSATVTTRHIMEKYMQKETTAIKALNNHFNYLATGIAGLINVLSPQKVVISGELAGYGDFYIENIRNRVLPLVLKETSVFTNIVAANLGDQAGTLGAAALAVDLSNHTNNSNNQFVTQIQS